ncbi:DNAJC18 isoform 7 [Pan troglodytes]|uniref:DNAJC18 isoform 6 n=2 Tax=Hominidae TaxID=9604 RepID=A0A2J8VPI6_PONAB|nr:DNAJC18 isoform 7 [Pan troglodytes]PNJ59437.1 DNAJC18 isoform 6 [Pongo abelii]
MAATLGSGERWTEGSRNAEITMKFWEFLEMPVTKSLRKLTENSP